MCELFTIPAVRIHDTFRSTACKWGYRVIVRECSFLTFYHIKDDLVIIAQIYDEKILTSELSLLRSGKGMV